MKRVVSGAAAEVCCVGGIGGSSAAHYSKSHLALPCAALDRAHSPLWRNRHRQPLVLRQIAAIDIGIVIGIVVATVIEITDAAAKAEMPAVTEVIVHPGKVLTSQTAAARAHMDAAEAAADVAATEAATDMAATEATAAMAATTTAAARKRVTRQSRRESGGRCQNDQGRT
jgi:hypothetical protein